MTTTEIKRDQDRINRNYTHGGTPCYLCGKELRTGARNYCVSVLQTTDHSAVLLATSEDNDARCGEGWFEIGSDCAKSVPAGFKAK